MNNHLARVSIIIPTHNRATTIIRSVESVLKQDYPNIEVIIVDDCSDDETRDLISDKYDNDPRVIYKRLERNMGACYARNLGTKIASGKYIAFQDSDDIWPHDKLTKQIANMSKGSSLVDFCTINVHRDKSIIKIPTKKQERLIKRHGIAAALAYGNFISTQAIIAEANVFHKYQFDNQMPRLQDYDLALRLASDETIKISYTKSAQVDVYMQKNSISMDDLKLYQAANLMLRKKYNLRNKNKKRLNAWLYKIIASNDTEYKSAVKHYKQSLKEKFNLNTLAHLILLKWYK